MDEAKALTIVAALADGINPLTGEVFPVDSPYQSPDIVRALFMARAALDGKPRAKPRTGLPDNAGKAWTVEEDGNLLADFDRGCSLAELARLHARTAAGIQARLEKHGRLQPAPLLRGSGYSRRDPGRSAGGASSGPNRSNAGSSTA